MSPWAVVALCGAATVVLKGAGPLVLGGRPVPGALLQVLRLLGPALLAALVATGTVGGDRRLVVDARALGVLVAAVAVWRRLPTLVVVVLAAAVTAGARALT